MNDGNHDKESRMAVLNEGTLKFCQNPNPWVVDEEAVSAAPSRLPS